MLGGVLMLACVCVRESTQRESAARNVRLAFEQLLHKRSVILPPVCGAIKKEKRGFSHGEARWCLFF